MATPVNNATHAPVQHGTRKAERSESTQNPERAGTATAAEEQAEGGVSTADTLSLSEAARQLGGQGVSGGGSRHMDADAAAEMANKLHDLISASGAQAMAAHGSRVSGREVARLLNVTA